MAPASRQLAPKPARLRCAAPLLGAVQPSGSPAAFCLPACQTQLNPNDLGIPQLAPWQTTNKIFNDELFDLLDTRTVLSWQRVRTANWLARDGQAS